MVTQVQMKKFQDLSMETLSIDNAQKEYTAITKVITQLDQKETKYVQIIEQLTISIRRMEENSEEQISKTQGGRQPKLKDLQKRLNEKKLQRTDNRSQRETLLEVQAMLREKLSDYLEAIIQSNTVNSSSETTGLSRSSHNGQRTHSVSSETSSLTDIDEEVSAPQTHSTPDPVITSDIARPRPKVHSTGSVSNTDSISITKTLLAVNSTRCPSAVDPFAAPGSPSKVDNIQSSSSVDAGVKNPPNFANTMPASTVSPISAPTSITMVNNSQPSLIGPDVAPKAGTGAMTNNTDSLSSDCTAEAEISSTSDLTATPGPRTPFSITPATVLGSRTSRESQLVGPATRHEQRSIAPIDLSLLTNAEEGILDETIDPQLLTKNEMDIIDARSSNTMDMDIDRMDTSIATTPGEQSTVVAAEDSITSANTPGRLYDPLASMKVDLDDAKYHISPSHEEIDEGKTSKMTGSVPQDISGMNLLVKRPAEDGSTRIKTKAKKVKKNVDTSEKKRFARQPGETEVQWNTRRAKSIYFQDLAKEEFAAFNTNPGKSMSINNSVRRLCKLVGFFAPLGGTGNRRLAMEIMRTNRENYVCGYHTIHDKKTKCWDTDGQEEDRTFECTGVPIEPAKKIRKNDTLALNGDSDDDDDEANSESGVSNSREGYMSCGCEWETVLVEFYHWKTSTIWSPTLNVTEQWGAHELLSPRERGLVYGKWEEQTGQKLDDMWKLKQEVGVNGRPRGLYTVQVLPSEQLEAQISLLQSQYEILKREGR